MKMRPVPALEPDLQSQISLDPRVPVAQPRDWRAFVQDPPFQRLMQAKRRAIGSMLAGSLGLFFVMMLLAGYARPFMAMKILGPLNVGYAMILLTYVMCWGLAILYAFIAHRVFDPLAAKSARDAETWEMTR